ncbi:hypothetical protein AAHE18_15G097300 [Arachis hypogaea]
MENSGSGAIDCGVGSIVWVRRRNGSWWPGQILGPHELSGSHLTSPRSGTPVKLLGREDASVDWYNLEKSKRVKPFRCGEFDGCIERAESSQGMPLKKREKYARREDAILHALELERQMLKKQEKLGAGQMGVGCRAKRSRYSSETEADKDEEMTISETGQDAEEEESTSSEDLDELAISADMPLLYPREPSTRNEAVSKWQLKGKRNSRSFVKRSVGAPDGKGVRYGADVEQGSHIGHKRLGPNSHYYKNGLSDVFDDTEQTFGFEDEFSLTPRAASKGQTKVRHGVDWDVWGWEDQPATRGYWDYKGFAPGYGDRYHYDGRMRPFLVDVDLKVQASYRKEPVPIVSLMSKLDGRAIIGHPIQIETLKDGSSDMLFPAFDDFNNDGIGIEGSSVLPPAWRTARRTANFRVPRPHLSSSNGAEAASDFSLDQERFEYRRLNAGSSSYKGSFSISRKSGRNSPGPSIDKKSMKKGSKKVSLSSSQKTRTLSSLSSEHNHHSKKPLIDSSFYQTNRLIKPEVSGLTTVACIPVKLVFSRLLEKINRPPLKAASNAALLNSDVERNS